MIQDCPSGLKCRIKNDTFNFFISNCHTKIRTFDLLVKSVTCIPQQKEILFTWSSNVVRQSLAPQTTPNKHLDNSYVKFGIIHNITEKQK